MAVHVLRKSDRRRLGLSLDCELNPGPLGQVPILRNVMGCLAVQVGSECPLISLSVKMASTSTPGQAVFDVLFPAGFPVYENQDTHDFEAAGLDSIDGLDGGAARVMTSSMTTARRPGRTSPSTPAGRPHAVFLGLFAYSERVQGGRLSES